MRERHGRIAVGLLVLAAACARTSADVGPPLDYKGVALTRLVEMPESAPAGGPAALLDSRFARACAQRLRDPRNGREFLIVRSNIQTASRTERGAAVTRLSSATGDYATVESTVLSPRHLRVDCVTSRAIDWVAGGDSTVTRP